MKLAITGGTGFVGGRLIAAAAAAGHEVQALTRRFMRPRTGMSWVQGTLDDHAALDALVAGTDAVIHVAGILKSRSAEEFEKCNVAGTKAVVDAAAAAGVERFVHVSSLSAREPALSLYGASKARSEEVVRASGLAYAIVRPPAVYGPGDKETLELFKMAERGLVFLPAQGRLSVIHVDDLGRLLLALADPGVPAGLEVEPDDGRFGGWTHREFGDALAAAVGRKAACIPVPGGLLRFAGRIDELVRGDAAKLTRDRASYFSHPDWVVTPGLAPPAGLWAPQIPTAEGLAATANWYRSRDWL